MLEWEGNLKNNLLNHKYLYTRVPTFLSNEGDKTEEVVPNGMIDFKVKFSYLLLKRDCFLKPTHI